MLNRWQKDFGPQGKVGSFESQFLMDTSKLDPRMINADHIKLVGPEEVEEAVRKRWEVYSFLDLAWSKKVGRESDYSAICTIGFDRKHRRLYILHIDHVRHSPSKLVSMIRAEYDEFKPQKIWIERTPVTSREFKALLKNPELRDLKGVWKPFQPTGKKGLDPKQARAYRLAREVELARVFAVTHPYTGWWKTARAEIERFPGALHDDIFDALCQLVIKITSKKHTPELVGMQAGSHFED